MINAIGHQTGRTSQMLRYAIEEAKTKDVIVIAANQQQVFSFRVMAERLKRETTSRPSGITSRLRANVPNERALTIRSINDVDLDLRTGKIRGIPDTTVVLVDHYAIELAISWALNQWLMWNTEIQK